LRLQVLGLGVADLDQYLLDPKNIDWFMQRYFAWLRIKAISADPANSDFDASIAKLAEIGRECGITLAQPLRWSGLPALDLGRAVDPNLPTVLVYRHYYKQPADVKDRWHVAEPFDPQL